MKKMLAVICLMSISFSAMAAKEKECKVDVYASIFRDDETLFHNIPINDSKFITAVETWQDCYNFAIQRAEAYPNAMDLTLTGWRIKGGKAETTAMVYLEWQFSDGYYIFDSNGKVTAQTKLVLSSPAKGDFRIRLDGKARFE